MVFAYIRVWRVQRLKLARPGWGVIPAVPQLVWSQLTPPDLVAFSPACGASVWTHQSVQETCDWSIISAPQSSEGLPARSCQPQQTHAHMSGMQRATCPLASDPRLLTWRGIWFLEHLSASLERIQEGAQRWEGR